MSKYFLHKEAVCDRYKHESPQMVYCEGVKDGTVVHLAFSDRGIALDYKKKYCRGDYSKCPLHDLPRDEVE